jgi:hypothetical protein
MVFGSEDYEASCDSSDRRSGSAITVCLAILGYLAGEARTLAGSSVKNLIEYQIAPTDGRRLGPHPGLRGHASAARCVSCRELGALPLTPGKGRFTKSPGLPDLPRGLVQTG